MPAYAFAVPIVSGKTDDVKNLGKIALGERRSEHDASRKRLGMTAERAWIQTTPMGDFAIVYHEADNPEKVMPGMGSSDDPYDVWFRDNVKDIHNFDLANPPDLPPPEEMWNVTNPNLEGTSGKRVGFLAPISKGKTGDLRKLIKEMEGREEETVASWDRRGVISEQAWLNQTPEGDMLVIVQQFKDPEAGNKAFAESKDPFDLWLKEKIQEIHGFSVEDMAKAPLPESFFDWSSS